MRLTRLLTFACALAAPTLLLAAGPWDGTWKLDLAKSHFTGTTFTYFKSTTGKWRVSFGNVGFDLLPDGQPYPTMDPQDTMAITMKGPRALHIENAFDGKTQSVTEETLSVDGKTLTDHTTGTRPDGSAINDTTTYVRASAGEGFFGVWKSTKVSTDHAGLYKIDTDADGTITWDIPDFKNTFKGKADGNAVQLIGPTVPEGMMMSIKQLSPTELTYAINLKGVPFMEGRATLVDNGKAMTDISWVIGASNERTTSYYVKQ